MKWIIWTVSWYVVCALEAKWHQSSGVYSKSDEQPRSIQAAIEIVVWIVGMVKFW